MISVLVWCWSKQADIDKTIPAWLEQKGVDLEIVIAAGPDIVLPSDTRIKRIDSAPPPKMGRNYNNMLASASGDIVLITQADMLPRDTCLLSKMLCHIKPFQVVSAEFYKNKGIAPGIYLNCMMAEKKAIQDIGGWYEAFDCPAMAAHEDTDLVASLLEAQYDVKILHIDNPDTGLMHIDHDNGAYDTPEYKLRMANGFAIYSSRHGQAGLIALYVKQFARNMREKRELQMRGYA